MSQQALVYSLVGRGSTILAEHAVVSGNFDTIAMQCLQNLPSNVNKFSSPFLDHTFHFLMDNEFVFLVVADESIGISSPFVFLERVKDDFSKFYEASISSMGSHPLSGQHSLANFGSRLEELLHSFLTPVEVRDSIDETLVTAVNTERANAAGAESFVGEEKMQEHSPVVESIGEGEVGTTEEDANLIPIVGMEFESIEAAHGFYNSYAKHAGFGTRKKSTSCKRGTRELFHAIFACAKEGFKQKNENTKNPRPDTREGCMARMTIKKDKNSEKWIVTRVILDHTHPINPLKSASCHSCKFATPTEKHKPVISPDAEPQTTNVFDPRPVEMRYAEPLNVDSQMKGTPAGFAAGKEKAVLKTKSNFETQAADFYKEEIFKKFQDEISRMHNCSTRCVKADRTIVTYMVKEHEQLDNGAILPKDYEVIFNSSGNFVFCVCRLFESQGILCRHALLVLMDSGVYKIPSHYLLKRWKKDTENTNVLDEGCSRVQGAGWMQRYDDLCRRSILFARDAALNEQTYDVAVNALREAMRKILLEEESVGSFS